MPGVATPREESVDLGMQMRRARVVPESLDMEARTVEVTWTTGAMVERYDFWSGRKWNEILSTKAEHVRMDRLTSGRAAVLDNHGSWRGVHGGSSQGRIGVIDSATIGDEPRAVLRFSRRPGVNEIIQDIQDGVLTDVSVGYRIHELTDVTEDKGSEVRDMLATDWEPYEISVADIGADAGAHVRSQEQGETFPVRVLTRHTEEPGMPQAKTEPAPGAAPENNPAPIVDVDKERSEASKLAQRALLETQGKIRDLVRAASLGQEFEDKLVGEEGVTFERAATEVSKALQERQAGTLATSAPSGNPGQFSYGEDEVDKFSRGLQRTLAMKLGPVGKGSEATYAAEDCPEANGLRGHSLARLAEEYLRRSGAITPTQMLQPREVWKRAFHSTTDFPLVTGAVLNKQLEAAFGLYPGTWAQFSRSRSAKDFKEMYNLWTGEPFTMDLIEEGGEYTAASFGERRSNFRVRKYGRQIAFTWEMFVNDDLDALSAAITMFGFEASDLRNRLAWGLINDNVTLSDTGALFNSTAQTTAGGHDNLVADGTLTETNLNLMWLKFQDRYGVNSGAAGTNETRRRVVVTPTALVVPPQRRLDAQKALGTYAPATADTVRVFTQDDFSIVTEPILQDVATEGPKQYYLVGRGPGVTPFEHANLEGEGESPTLDRHEDFDIDAVKWKGRSVFGVHVPSYHCWVRSAIA